MIKQPDILQRRGAGQKFKITQAFYNGAVDAAQFVRQKRSLATVDRSDLEPQQDTIDVKNESTTNARRAECLAYGDAMVITTPADSLHEGPNLRADVPLFNQSKNDWGKGVVAWNAVGQSRIDIMHVGGITWANVNLQNEIDDHADIQDGKTEFISHLSGSWKIVYRPFNFVQNEIQTITITGSPTGGTFTLSFEGQTTNPLAFDASASEVDAELELLSNIAIGDVTATGASLPAGTITVEFTGALANKNVGEMTGDGGLLTGGQSPAVVIKTTQGGNQALCVVQYRGPWQREVKAVTVESILRDGSGDVTVFLATGGTGPPIAQPVTLVAHYNWLSNEVISATKEVLIKWFPDEGQWVIVAAECE